MKLSRIIKCILIIIVLYVLSQKIHCITPINKINDNIVYITDFLSQEDYQEVLQLDKSLSNFIFETFRYSRPIYNDNIYNIFYGKKYIH